MGEKHSLISHDQHVVGVWPILAALGRGLDINAQEATSRGDGGESGPLEELPTMDEWTVCLWHGPPQTVDTRRPPMVGATSSNTLLSQPWLWPSRETVQRK
jgi:hypothetical protein